MLRCQTDHSRVFSTASRNSTEEDQNSIRWMTDPE
jgi:hypothetical protein